MHPGAIVTDLGRHLDEDLFKEMIARAEARAESGRPAAVEDRSPAAPAPREGIEFKSVEAGAATQVWAATALGLEDHNGAYLADCRPGVLGADPSVNGYLPYLTDDGHAAALWELSEKLVGASFVL